MRRDRGATAPPSRTSGCRCRARCRSRSPRCWPRGRSASAARAQTDGGGWRVGDQVEVQHQAHTGAAHDLPRRLQPRRGQLEHPARHRPQSRCPDRVIGRVAADPEDQRAVSGYVQHRQHAGERGHVSGESGQRPVLGRQPEERGRHRCRPVARRQRNHDRRRRSASRCGGSGAWAGRPLRVAARVSASRPGNEVNRLTARTPAMIATAPARARRRPCRPGRCRISASDLDVARTI